MMISDLKLLWRIVKKKGTFDVCCRVQGAGCKVWRFNNKDFDRVFNNIQHAPCNMHHATSAKDKLLN